MTRRLLLVRHPPVEDHYRGYCYGVSDIALGVTGFARAAELAIRLAAEPITLLFHSGLSRAAAVTDRITALTGQPAVADTRLCERDFGSWELRPWAAIYAESGNAMDGMLDDPTGWRPPGGETTYEMRDRVLAWYRALPDAGTIVAVAHGGPIAALRGTLTGVPVRGWLKLVPEPGSMISWEDNPS
ncbi:histidine phosphatase family protein [Fimbriiglobus ruber]|uniref:Alpha-ribazole-5'-phosphate phosphatase n=1 Tax=Fimbriiglobus ruber TaxID=1908690 RepID=A0A225DIJ9_9BACT|nr:histidine phosphatase family protein [Fimbriiglobus ruber]OWK41271.1 Alpha-ribazole-5'-phosphate phosphatase [Fimbriiglobus ruber]